MKGIILEIKSNKAVLLKEDGAITEIKNKNYIIGQHILLNRPNYKKHLIIAACFIFCCVFYFSGYKAYNTPCSYIYVDINPSMRLDINCFNRIIDIIPLNDDAEQLALSHNFIGVDFEACINEIVSSCVENGYLNNENNDIEIGFSTKNDNLNNEISNVCEELIHDNYAVSSTRITDKKNSEAINFKTSPKRLDAIESYSSVFGGTLEENTILLRDMSVKEINRRISSVQHIDDAVVKDEASQPEQKQKKKEKTDSTHLPKSEKRINAIKKHSKTHGGAMEESSELLQDLSVAEINEPATENKYPEKSHFALPKSEKRLNAIKSYTEIFGGTLEENSFHLRKKSVKEIKEIINNALTEKPRQTVE